MIEQVKVKVKESYYSVTYKNAFCHAVIDRVGIGWITNLNVNPSARRQHQGSKVVIRAMRFLRKQKCNVVVAIPENPESKQLFLNLGWERSGYWPKSLQRILTKDKNKEMRGNKRCVIFIA